MRFRIEFRVVVVLMAVTLCAGTVVALPKKGDPAPPLKAIDIRGQEVSLDTVVKASPDPLVILFFFTVKTGEEISVKLRTLDVLYGREKLEIIGVGFEEEEKTLREFADRFHIKYYILKSGAEEAEYGPFDLLPVTFLIDKNKLILNVLRGGEEGEALILAKVAEMYLTKHDAETAKGIAEEAVKAGEDQKTALEIKGYALTIEGKLDEAEGEFGEIDSKEGMAKVALERGQFDKAVQIANQAGPNSGYADTIRATALMRGGKLDEAERAFDAAATKPASDWQTSEAMNGLGRVLQEKGAGDAAIAKYQEAVALDPYNVVALSNEGAVHRERGDLDKAAEVLKKARDIRDDDLVTLMLRQIQQELKKANDVQRTELIRKQIGELRALFEKQKAEGTDKPADTWTSRPLVLAFLPSQNQAPVFFERAGTDVALRREIEARLQRDERVTVVEREVLDKLLQELNLGASELTDPDTQLRLGRVLSAQLLGFIDFGQLGPDTLMYLRMVNTETTKIEIPIRKNLKDSPNLIAFVDAVSTELLNAVTAERRLQGFIADASDENAVLIGLGQKHGLMVGQRFMVIEDGGPIKIGEREIARRPVLVATLEVTEAHDEYGVCKVLKKNEGVQLAAEMKIKELPKR